MDLSSASPLCTYASPAAALAASFSRMRNAVTQIPGGGSATAARIDPLYGVTLAAVALAFGHSERDSGPWQTEDLAQ